MWSESNHHTRPTLNGRSLPSLIIRTVKRDAGSVFIFESKAHGWPLRTVRGENEDPAVAQFSNSSLDSSCWLKRRPRGASSLLSSESVVFLV